MKQKMAKSEESRIRKEAERSLTRKDLRQISQARPEGLLNESRSNTPVSDLPSGDEKVEYSCEL